MEQMEQVLPGDIEKRSFEIISEELKKQDKKLNPQTELVVKRVIHTTADFDYADNMVFSDNAVEIAKKALKDGISIVTDTHMARSGINKGWLKNYGGEVLCFMSDGDVAEAAKKNKTTRAAASMDKAAALSQPFIFAIGNAPTALLRLEKLIEDGRIKPVFIIAVPVGFVNVVQAKERIMKTGIPYISAKGRKGGSTVAAAICNALLYDIE